ncbi:MAG: hypothetical protein ABIH49_02530 [archaeon]
MTNEKKERSEYSKGFGAGALFLGGIGGLVMIITTGLTTDVREKYVREQTTPISIEYQDINHDTRKDIVVKTKEGTKYVFLQTEDRNYSLAAPRKETSMQYELPESILEKSVQEER